MPLNFMRMNENDLYDADRVCNKNFEYIEKNVLPSGVMTKLEYDSLVTKVEDKLYAVRDGSIVQLYLGGTPIAGGAQAITTAGIMTAVEDGTVHTIVGVSNFREGEE